MKKLLALFGVTTIFILLLCSVIQFHLQFCRNEKEIEAEYRKTNAVLAGYREDARRLDDEISRNRQGALQPKEECTTYCTYPQKIGELVIKYDNHLKEFYTPLKDGWSIERVVRELSAYYYPPILSTPSTPIVMKVLAPCPSQNKVRKVLRGLLLDNSRWAKDPCHIPIGEKIIINRDFIPIIEP